MHDLARLHVQQAGADGIPLDVALSAVGAESAAGGTGCGWRGGVAVVGGRAFTERRGGERGDHTAVGVPEFLNRAEARCGNEVRVRLRHTRHAHEGAIGGGIDIPNGGRRAYGTNGLGFHVDERELPLGVVRE